MGRSRSDARDRPDGIGGDCCGAPAVAYPTAKFVGRHRQIRVDGTNLADGSVWPCRRALDCEMLYRRLRRAGGDAGLHKQPRKNEEIALLDFRRPPRPAGAVV